MNVNSLLLFYNGYNLFAEKRYISRPRSYELNGAEV